MKRALIAGGLIAAIAAVTMWARQTPGGAHRPAPIAATDGGHAAIDQASAAVAAAGSTAVAPVAKAAIDRARRAEIADAIAKARQSARSRGAANGNPAAGGGGAAPVDETPGELTKDEIRTGVRDVIPMLVDCYSTEIERDPRLAGELVAHLTVDSEPDLGMVVTVGGLDIDGALGGSPDFRDCVSATLEAVVLPPLPVGGHVDINYPLAFSNDPDPPADGTAPSPRRAPPRPDRLAQEPAAAPAEERAR